MDDPVRTLKEIEADPEENPDTIDVVQEIASRPNGIRILLDAFAESRNAMVARSVAFVLAQRASSPTAATRSDVMELIRRLRVDDESTLTNCLTAIDRLASVDVLTDAPPELAPFLLRCVAGAPSLQMSVVGAMKTLERGGVLARFGADERRRLREALEPLASLPTYGAYVARLVAALA